ncbi:hypothetical protein TNCT_215131 [Trichonephila clavata]|uniref:Uncharacterized protein n=1 Tax=Trichonephila clavata TaxID=2740835 RepID=A0A8X6EX85_TRICU|nr:hypothetical protein TNCT_215131 [Trichonephila clavata]
MCIKCGDNHRTLDCPKKVRSEIPHCINCNENGHIASHRKCNKFPKPRKIDKQTNETKYTPIPPNTRTVTADVSYASVCRNEPNNQMAPREEIAASSAKSFNEKERISLPSDSNMNFGNFAVYIAELQNITSKFPEIFQALRRCQKLKMIMKN